MQPSRKNRLSAALFGLILLGFGALYLVGKDTPELTRTPQEIALPEGRF